MAVGTRTLPVKAPSVLAEVHSQAARMGELAAQARRIASTILSGWHGRRRQGPGENFWQFRPYIAGESATLIDWRRSARDNHTYIREREWDAAQTVFLWPDLSASMRYQSAGGQHSKEMRAIMVILILAEIFARNGERIAIPGLLAPTHARNVAALAALALSGGGGKTITANFSRVSRHAEIIIASDFLNTAEETEKIFAPLVENHVHACLVEIADPAEALFPFSGHITFCDPENGQEFTAGRAQSHREAYQRLYLARRHSLAAMCRQYGWGFTTSMTDQPLSKTLSYLTALIGTHAGKRRRHA